MSGDNFHPKKKGPRWKTSIGKHKPIVAGLIIALVAIAGIISGVVLFLGEEGETTFIMGGYYPNPAVGQVYALEFIDPLQTVILDGDPFILKQIAETLFTEKWTGNYYDNVPHLVEEYEWNDPENPTELTCTLRKGIKFHDGTPLNATAVKWNFDRLQRLLNSTDFIYPYVWYHADGTLILNETIVPSEYTVKFVLNKPYVSFIALLTFPHTSIVSPRSTPENRVLNVLNETLIGTGPYIYESNVIHWEKPYLNTTTTLIANHNYWGRPKPTIDKFIFLSANITYSNELFLSGKTDYAIGSDLYLEDYHNNPRIIVDEYVGREISYVNINNKKIDTPMRKAISYALNYTALLEVYAKCVMRPVERAKSPLSKGTLYANWEDFDVPIYDVQTARQALLDAEWPGTTGLTADDNINLGNEWEEIANSTNPLGTYNYSISYSLVDLLGPELIDFWILTLKENLEQIGVKMEFIFMTIVDFYETLTETDMSALLWYPDFNDPCNNIDPWFSTEVDGWNNNQHTNDSLVQQWIEEGLVETNPVVREQIYYNIQKRLIEEVYPVAWICSNIYYDIYRSNLRGWQERGREAGSLRYLYFKNKL